MYFCGAGMILPFWHLSADSRSPIAGTAFSLMIALVVGPMSVIALMGLRALRHVPVTNRDIWRTTWILATVVTAGILLISKAISVLLVTALGGHVNASAEAMLLSAVYDFAWTGAVLPLFPFLVFAEHRLDSGGTGARSLVEAGRFVGLLVCFGLPVLASGELPARVGGFTPATAAILIACLAFAFGTLAWTPRRGLLAGERARPQRAAAPEDAGTQPRGVDRLTGISRVAGPYLLATLALPPGICLALAAYGVLAGSGAWWFLPRTPSVFDPQEIGDLGSTIVVLMPAAILMMVGIWNPWVGVLKVLPVSVRQINALLLLTPFAAWTILWLLGWSAYVFVYGMPQTSRPGFVFGMAALSALAHAVLLRFQGSMASFWIITLIGGLLAPLVKGALANEAAAQNAFALIGAVALGMAALINHHTLTRSTSSCCAYGRNQPPFGMTAPSDIR
jgi:hypothetical protein